MTPSRPTSLSLRTQLRSIDDAVSQCDPGDYFAVTRLTQQLAQLHRQLEHERQEDVAPLADLARHVAEILGTDGQLSASATLQVVEALVDVVHAMLGFARDEDVESQASAVPDAGVAEAPESFRDVASGTVRRPGLQLVANKRLGEMLMQMSMLSPKQIETALEQQRVTGCRFGEALIQLKLLTREAVESALRMQRARRRSDDNPWSNG